MKSAAKLLAAHKLKNIVVEVRHHQTDMVEFVHSFGYTCALIREARSMTAITCEGRDLAQVSADVQAIGPNSFSDMFCCVA